MLRIIYLSSSVEYLNEKEIGSLLAKSRKKNIEKDITGVLLYIEGDILQVLEGPKVAMLDLFESIKTDPRHKGIITIINTEIKEKNFPKWNMAFCSTTYAKLRKTEGYENLEKSYLTLISDSLTLSFLNTFIKSHLNEIVFV